MCHLVLALPVLALPVFWLMPLPEAILVYALIAAASAALYAFTWKLMRAPRMNGPDAMIGRRTTVFSTDERGAVVLFAGELWSARGRGEKLAEGDKATIVGVEGLKLVVRKGA